MSGWATFAPGHSNVLREKTNASNLDQKAAYISMTSHKTACTSPQNLDFINIAPCPFVYHQPVLLALCGVSRLVHYRTNNTSKHVLYYTFAFVMYCTHSTQRSRDAYPLDAQASPDACLLGFCWDSTRIWGARAHKEEDGSAREGKEWIGGSKGDARKREVQPETMTGQ